MHLLHVLSTILDQPVWPQIWFSHSLEPIHEDLRRWEHEQASPGGPATQHAIFTGHAGNLIAAMQDLVQGKSLSHFTSVIKHKLGDDVSQVFPSSSFMNVQFTSQFGSLLSDASFSKRVGTCLDRPSPVSWWHMLQQGAMQYTSLASP